MCGKMANQEGITLSCGVAYQRKKKDGGGGWLCGSGSEPSKFYTMAT